MIVSPTASSGPSRSTVPRTNAAGTMIHTWRGVASLATRSGERGRTAEPFALQRGDGAAVDVVDDTVVARLLQAADHIGAHPSQADHCQLHPVRLPRFRTATLRHVDQERLQRDVEACTTAHQRLLATLEGLTDDEAWAPSVLPGWTVGHVLTHLARNADGQVRMLRAAEIGAVAHQYEGGAAGRAADIDAGTVAPRRGARRRRGNERVSSRTGVVSDH